MDYNEIEQDKKRLEELGILLLGEGGFFEHMPEDQKEAFGEAIKLLAKIQILETVGDFGKSGVSVGLNLDNFNIGEMLKNLIVIKPNAPTAADNGMYNGGYNACPNCNMNPCMCNQTYVKPPCGACMCEPCMCAGEPESYDPMAPKYYDCVNCGSTPCVCAPEYDPAMDAAYIDPMSATDSTMYVDPAMMTDPAYYDPAMMPPMSGDTTMYDSGLSGKTA